MPAWDGKISDKGEILRQLDGTQKAIEYALAVIIPTVLAVMMFSYIIYPEIFQTAFLAAVGTAIFTLVPASLAQKLHYQCWARNTMPQRIVSGLIGLIYISLVAVISVSLISASKDLEPQQPTTLAIIASLLLGLIIVMVYNSRTRERFGHMDIRFFHRSPAEMINEIQNILKERGEEFKITGRGRRTLITLETHKVVIIVVPQLWSSTEIMIECADASGAEVSSIIKRGLDTRARPGRATLLGP